MIAHLPVWITVIFIATCIMTVLFFYLSNGRPKKVTSFIICWSIIQSILAYCGYYQDLSASPPRFALVLIPSTLFIIYGLLPKQQKWIYKTRKTDYSTLLHIVRLPVEIILFSLFLHGMVPQLMTFEGKNYDIIIGITAPIMIALSRSNKISKKALLGWNIVGLIFVLFILCCGILSSELPIQQFGFEQPNRAIMYFPFVLLPATIVPLVIWTHISDIIYLRKELETLTRDNPLI